MRRGCISLGEVKCSECDQVIPYPERYVVVDEENGLEVEQGGVAARYCADCALKKGYAQWKEEKGERTLTFLP